MNESARQFPSLEGDYTCFGACGEIYAVPTAQVRSVNSLPVIRKVPKAPDYITGVVNLHGRIVLIINPYKRFDLSRGDDDSELNYLILVQPEHTPYGIMADGAPFLATFNAAAIEPLNPLATEQADPYIAGMVRMNEKIIHLLDVQHFLQAGVEINPKVSATYDRFLTQVFKSAKRKSKETGQWYLTVIIGSEEYAIALHSLKEVLPFDAIEEMGTKGPDFVIGLIKSGNSTLPVIDLQRKLGLTYLSYDRRSRAVVVDTGEYVYVVAAHAIKDVLEIPAAKIKPAPAIITGRNAPRIKGVAILEQGSRLVLLLNAARILGSNEVKKLTQLKNIQMFRRKRALKTIREGEKSMLVFKIAHRYFCLPLEGLSEVINFQPPVKVPKTPEFIMGLVSKKGELIPVIDLPKRLEIIEGKRSTPKRIVIIRQSKTQYGIAVDAVTDIIRVTPEELQLAPEIVDGVAERFIQGVVCHENTPIALNTHEVFLPKSTTQQKKS